MCHSIPFLLRHNTNAIYDTTKKYIQNVCLPQINWDILGPNSEMILPALNSDIGDPVNGSFYFEEAEGGLRTISLELYPHEEVEVQETYIIRLSIVKGETELDPKAANITLTVSCTYFGELFYSE